MANKVPVSVSLLPSLVKKLDKLSKAMGMNRSALIERLLLDGLEDTEDAVKALTDPVVGRALVEVFADRNVMKALLTALGEKVNDEQLDLFGKMMARAAVKGKGDK